MSQKIKEMKCEKIDGQTILIKVYTEESFKTKRQNRRKTSVKTRGRQTSDFKIIGKWQSAFKVPYC